MKISNHFVECAVMQVQELEHETSHSIRRCPKRCCYWLTAPLSRYLYSGNQQRANGKSSLSSLCLRGEYMI